jgi:hypothetical protein
MPHTDTEAWMIVMLATACICCFHDFFRDPYRKRKP